MGEQWLSNGLTIEKDLNNCSPIVHQRSPMFTNCSTWRLV